MIRPGQPHRCPECRTRRASLLTLAQHLQRSGHRACTCGGYHYAHRPGSPYCTRNAMSDVRHAARRGDPLSVLLDIAAHCAWDRPGKPFTTWRHA